MSHVNINSLQSDFKRNALQAMITSKSSDVILINETKIDENTTVGAIRPPGYYMKRNDNKIGMGGVAIMVKESLNYVHNHAISNEQYETIEQIGGTINYNQTKILFVTIYKRPNYNLHDTDCLKNLLKKINDMKLPTIITGDFNLPDINWKNIDNSHVIEVILNIT